MDRLTIEEARRRIAAGCKVLGIDSERIDWERPAGEATIIALAREAVDGAAQRKALRGIIDTLLSYQSAIDYEAGAQDERANAAALLRQQADRFERAKDQALGELAEARCGAKCSELRTMAAYIERGDRAEVKP